jgi:hypothetical protein
MITGLEIVAAKYVGTHLLAAHAATLHAIAAKTGAHSLDANVALASQHPIPAGQWALHQAAQVHSVMKVMKASGTLPTGSDLARWARESGLCQEAKDALSDLLDKAKDVKDLKDLLSGRLGGWESSLLTSIRP